MGHLKKVAALYIIHETEKRITTPALSQHLRPAICPPRLFVAEYVAAALGRLVLARAHGEVGRGEVALEGDARMPKREGQAGNNNHAALEAHEQRLVLGQLAVEAFAQLGHAINRADENGKGSSREA